MKKNSLIFASIALIAGMFTITSCNKTEDTTPPVITLDGNNPDRVEQFSATSYTEPGYTVVDDVDDVSDITFTIDGLTLVNYTMAGNYNVNYIATDKAGNSTTETRVVTVDGALYLDNFTYDAIDYPDGGSPGTQFIESITSDTDEPNKVYFTRFADYDNGVVYGTISGKTITIPTQTVTCGNPAAARTFAGAGDYFENFMSITITYTEQVGTTSASGHTIYTKRP